MTFRVRPKESNMLLLPFTKGRIALHLRYPGIKDPYRTGGQALKFNMALGTRYSANHKKAKNWLWLFSQLGL